MINLNWYKITRQSIDLYLADKAGLYVISVLFNNGDYYAIYAGQSTQLKTRVKQHFSDSETNEELKKYLKQDNLTFKISYAYCDRDDLDGVEKYLIFVLNPKFNKQDGNGDSRFECALPNVRRYPY